MSLMILVIVGVTLVYLSWFIHLYDEDSGDVEVNYEVINDLVFACFWGGVYSDDSWEPYSKSIYPFYVLVILLCGERLACMWIESKLGCTDEMIETYKKIELQDKKIKDILTRKTKIDKIKAKEEKA
jgi:hypothetical protein